MLSKEDFIQQTDFATASIEKMAGDASIKSFYRLSEKNRSAVLMLMPRDDSAYTAEAGLAKTCLPFLAIGKWLAEQTILVPEVLDKNIAAGFILLEDFGKQPYTKSHLPLAVELLNQLHKTKPPQALAYEGAAYPLPLFTKEIYTREPLLFLEWFLPEQNISIANEDGFINFWRDSWEQIETIPFTILLRDYHSPNFIIVPQGEGIRQLAVLDFQDALIGSPLYDLVSLTQDARIDISAQEEAHALKLYNHAFDDATYALLGAQRALKILGIFTRFAKQDNKPAYLKHIPRVLGYLQRNLAHPVLRPLSDWLNKNGVL